VGNIKKNDIKQRYFFSIYGILILLFLYAISKIFPDIENVLYDLNLTLIKSKYSESIAIVGIDSRTVADYGTYPLPRTVFAELIEKIESGNPSSLALNFLFPLRNEDSTGNDSLKSILSRMKNCVTGMDIKSVQKANQSSSIALLSPEVAAYKFKTIINKKEIYNNFIYAGKRIDYGDYDIVKNAAWSGFNNITSLHNSKKIRELIHVITIGDSYYPSFAIASAAAFLKIPHDKIVLDGKGAVILDSRIIKFSKSSGALKVYFAGKKGTVPTISALDVIKGNINRYQFKDKLVFVGITDPALLVTDFFQVATDRVYPSVEIWACATSNILNNSWIHENRVMDYLNYIFLFLIFPCLLFLLQRSLLKRTLLALLLCILSEVISLLLIQKYFCFWNPTFHFYGSLLIIIFSFAEKYKKILHSSR